MPQELLFELNGARVTPHIATFGGTSYQIANIGSVRVMQRKRYNPLAVIIFVLGLGILAAAIVKSRMTGLAEESFRRRDRSVSPSTYLAVAGVCAGFEDIRRRRGCCRVTQQGVCFQRSESC
jgi:Family of unknown function (DUF6232)